MAATAVAGIDESSGRSLLRFVHLLVGEIKHVPIDQPDLDRKVRLRHDAEIQELTRQGFS
jgi:hypothetical protein